jgi:hypothetical protein
MLEMISRGEKNGRNGGVSWARTVAAPARQKTTMSGHRVFFMGTPLKKL